MGTITLRDAIALALLHNPSLASFAWETRAREARILQVDRRPNPVLSVTAQDLFAPRLFKGGDPSQEVAQRQTTIELSQLVELGGKRTARRNLATADRELASWDYEAARINVLTAVTRSFIDVLAAQEMVALTKQTTELVQQVQGNVSARVTAGVASPIEETRSAVVLASSRLDLDRAVQVLEAARRQLVSHWGISEARFQSAVGDLSLTRELPLLAELVTRVASNPDLARWSTEISQRQAVLALEEARRRADVSISAGFRRYTLVGTSAFVVSASIPLQIFNRNKDAIQEASDRLAKAYEERRAAESRAAASLAEAYRALSTAYREVTVIRSDVQAGAQQAFEAVSEGYRLGRFGFMDVLDAQRTVVAVGGQYLRALTDYHRAVTDVERLIGAPLSETTGVLEPPRE